MNATHTSSEQSSYSSLANRYGTPKRGLSRKAWTILVSGALAVAVVAVGIVTVNSASPPVSSKDVGFSITDSTWATVDFRVTKDPAATAECAVQVLSSNYAVVGWKVVTIGPTSDSDGANGGRTTAERVSLRTESLGVTGTVDSCWISGESTS